MRTAPRRRSGRRRAGWLRTASQPRRPAAVTIAVASTAAPTSTTPRPPPCPESRTLQTTAATAQASQRHHTSAQVRYEPAPARPGGGPAAAPVRHRPRRVIGALTWRVYHRRTGDERRNGGSGARFPRRRHPRASTGRDNERFGGGSQLGVVVLNITLTQLRAFCAVAETRNFRTAAERLHLSQSGVSVQVAGLERGLRLALIDRRPPGWRLTKAGEVVLERARAIVEQGALLEREAAAIRSGVRGQFRLGATLSIADHSLSLMLSDYLRAHPEVRVSVRVQNTREIEN